MLEDKYPEHTKLSAISDKSQAIGEFVDWLGEQGTLLMRYETLKDTHYCLNELSANLRRREGVCQQWEREGRVWETHARCGGTGRYEVNVQEWVHERRGIEKLLAEFFGIDLQKIEDEKRAMLEEIRAIQVGRPT